MACHQLRLCRAVKQTLTKAWRQVWMFTWCFVKGPLQHLNVGGGGSLCFLERIGCSNFIAHSDSGSLLKDTWVCLTPGLVAEWWLYSLDLINHLVDQTVFLLSNISRLLVCGNVLSSAVVKTQALFSTWYVMVCAVMEEAKVNVILILQVGKEKISPQHIHQRRNQTCGVGGYRNTISQFSFPVDAKMLNSVSPF